MRKKIILGLVLFLSIGLIGCGTVTDVLPETKGGVEGYILAPDGETPVIGVHISVAQTTLSTNTNEEGYFLLPEVPTGNRTIIAFKGAFKVEFTVPVIEGQVANAGVKLLEATGKIGLNQGSFDDIGPILTSLGLEYEYFSMNLLADPNELEEFAILFFECGGGWLLEDSDEADNLKDFIAAGGVIYASDYALDIAETIFPEKITLLGKVGYGDPQDITATVLNSNLISLLGKDTVSLNYSDSPGWNVIESVASDVNIDIKGDIQVYDGLDLETKNDSPLLVHFTHGNGLIILTTFHNAAQATDDMLKILEQMAFGL